MESSPARAATMADVARTAGVSRTAVSFVLNGRSDASIPEATRARILAAAEQMGYRRNAAARALASQRSGLFGLVTEIVTSPFAADIIKGAQWSAWQDERFLLIAPSETNQVMEEAAIEKLLEQRIEGLIIAASWHQQIRVPANAYQMPCVLVHCFDEEGRLPSIVPDEEAGGRVAARTLLAAGHRNIGHITLPTGTPAQVGRLRGFGAELSTAGAPLADRLIVAGDGTAESGYRGASELLDGPNPPTAIFCGNDRMAMGAYDAIKERGLRIPQEISIVGFDDQQALADCLRPGLTTVALPYEEMGAAGVRKLTELTTGSRETSSHLALDCPLRQRSSVGIALR
ncbi:LacI family DNA-binding transcriptional regulator [Glutamicibacter endophyticus]|uniref:LacI family DNA-binding transcriptional regulator n=1 Tax=Glutamicibacter sp. PS TaxID=3075634 RepID=UPI00283F2131|nr:LacI family DNA-binding transcriptional regulator [Glutamicibacter sp. PS]MDR4534162.1 LacI family DNA-binding transcriptional regulator [Glutamicibacter sp. PS]